uniref:Uncharacterized protein n=1 Tax=Arundo donax TaxID=35708 RepID=A0A0A9G7D5_ARUDO
MLPLRPISHVRLACKPLRFSKLHNLTIFSGTPSSSSWLLNGAPRNVASLMTYFIGSDIISSYFRKRTLSGLAMLSLQYSRQ